MQWKPFSSKQRPNYDGYGYIAWKNASKRKSPQDKQDILLRQKWINTLRAGKNPITDEEIKKLLK